MSRLNVFVSYSSQEKIFAGNLKSMLSNFCGYSVFLAHDDLIPSLNFNEGIIEAIKSCDLFLPIISTHFRQSEYCDQELGMAIVSNKKIIPIKFDSTNPYGFLSGSHALRVRSTENDGAQQIVSEIGILCLKYFRGEINSKAKSSIIFALGNSAHFKHSNIIIPILCECPEYDQVELNLITKAIGNNYEIQRTSHGRKLHHQVY